MAVVLQARVKQKVDTEANWLSNPLPLLEGEMAIVINSNGAPINFKIGSAGDNKTFAQLPYMIDYAGFGSSMIMPTAPGGTLPNPGPCVARFMFVEPGVYYNPGGGSFTAAAETFTILFWDGSTWSPDVEVPLQVDLTGYYTKSEINSSLNGLIKPNGITEIDFSANARNCAIDAAGAIINDGNANYYSIYKQPITGGGYLKVVNTLDNTTNKRYLFYDATETIISGSIYPAINYGRIDIRVPSNAAFVTIYLVANAATDRGKIKLYKSTLRKNLLITRINGFGLWKKTPIAIPENTTLLDFSEYLHYQSYGVGGVITVPGNENYLSIYMMPISPNKRLKLINYNDTTTAKRFFYHDSGGSIIGSVAAATNYFDILLTTPSNAAYFSVNLLASWSADKDVDFKDMYLIQGDNEDAFKYKKLHGMAIDQLTTDFIKSISVGGTAASVSNGNATLPNVTTVRDGLMSKEDKIAHDAMVSADFQQQIDDIVVSVGEGGGVVTKNTWDNDSANPPSVTLTKTRFEAIEGTLGSSVNLASFGFHPDNDPHDNSIALQAALDVGGNLEATIPGEYKVDSTHYIYDNTKLTLGKDCWISLYRNAANKIPAYPLINAGAFTRTYNENIEVHGWKVITNGLAFGDDVPRILGLRGFLSFFYAKNIIITGFRCLEYDNLSFAMHLCTWENVRIIDTICRGEKDGIHCGKGSNLLIDGYIANTFDDAIALNAHDFMVSNPQVGNITNVTIRNVVEERRPLDDGNGHTIRFLSGSWLNWFTGMTVQQGDTVVSDGRIYRLRALNDGTTYISTDQPTHTSGNYTYPDGRTWYMSQDDDVMLRCSVKNVKIENVLLQQNKDKTAFAVNLTTGVFNRDYYPGSIPALNQNITFDNIVVDATFDYLIESRSEFDYIRITNSRFGANLAAICWWRDYLSIPQVVKGKLLLANNIYEGEQNQLVCSTGRTGSVNIINSYKEQEDFNLIINSGITVIANDLD